MVKSELIMQIATRFPDMPYKDVEFAVKEILDCMSEWLANGARIEIRGFGSFSLHYLPPRNAHNPRTGEKVATVGKYRPHFKPGKGLRERINDNRHIPLVETRKDDDEDAA